MLSTKFPSSIIEQHGYFAAADGTFPKGTRTSFGGTTYDVFDFPANLNPTKNLLGIQASIFFLTPDRPTVGVILNYIDKNGIRHSYASGGIKTDLAPEGSFKNCQSTVWFGNYADDNLAVLLDTFNSTITNGTLSAAGNVTVSQTLLFENTTVTVYWPIFSGVYGESHVLNLTMFSGNVNGIPNPNPLPVSVV